LSQAARVGGGATGSGRLAGRIALVTGASRGIGAAVARRFAAEGAQLVLVARTVGGLEELDDRIRQDGGQGATLVPLDLREFDAIDRLGASLYERFGHLDVLVGNAGVNPFYGPMSEIPDAAYDKILSTNVKANHWLCQMVAPDMIEKGSGSIMITSSTGAFSASEVLGTYNISKLADIALIRNLAAELGPKGVRVNAICPGLIRTDFAQALWDNPEAAQRANEQIPMRRLGEAEDLKALAVFLAADSSSYVTGQALTVCGGANMWS